MRASEIQHSFRRPIYLFLGLAAAVVLAGCNGPTKTGLEARADARERVDLVNAQLHFDQAHQGWETGQTPRSSVLPGTSSPFHRLTRWS